MGVNKNEEENKKLKIKILIPIIILIGFIFLVLYLDGIDYFSNNPLLKGIHVDNWVTFMSSIIAVLGTYIFTRMENKKSLKQQQEQFDEEKRRFDKEKKELEQQFQEEKEIQKEESDKQCIFEMISNNLIEKETSLIVNQKKYEYIINNEIYGVYCKRLNEASEGERLDVLKGGLNKYYKMYNDIVLLEAYMVSKKYKDLFEGIVNKRNEAPKKLKNPKRFLMDNKNNGNSCEDLLKKYKNEYLEIIKGVDNNGK